MGIPDSTAEWLLGADPWTAYATRTRLLGEPGGEEARRAAASATLADPRVKALVAEASEYFPRLATRHTDSKLSHYKMRMLADFGLRIEDGLGGLVEAAKARTKDGLYAIRQNIPMKGFDPAEEWNALPCDNPVVLYALLALGDASPGTAAQVERLKEAWSAGAGWFCGLPFVAGQFKREQAGCPMAGLAALEVFSLEGPGADGPWVRNAFAALEHHYRLGKSIYYFGRGKKFFAFKYPYVWYNALYVADVLVRFPFARGHEMTRRLVDWIRSGADAEGRYAATSVFLENKDWDFGNKKAPSPWITYLCHSVLDRAG